MCKMDLIVDVHINFVMQNLNVYVSISNSYWEAG